MSEQPSHRHWVLIETGGNQQYIFGSNRLRHVVGASQLVHDVGHIWVPEAVAACGLPAHAVVMVASGKALLLVDTAEQGHAVVRTVTRRALAGAPGLQVTGVVGPAFDPADPRAYEPARDMTYRLHADVRARRRDPVARDRAFAWHRLCRDTGLPAIQEEIYGEESAPASAGVLARSRARHRAKKRLADGLCGHAGIVPEHLDELEHSGWVAFIHADGNGVGGLFRDFVNHVAAAEGVTADAVSLQVYSRYQREVADELDEATWGAVCDAVAALPGTLEDLQGRLLPIVVGGDDVTVVCDAALAVAFVRAFADAFAARTAAQPTLSAIAQAATGHRGLTASAGIAVVKPHHPFATAYDLAEELTVSAKGLSEGGRTLAAFDIHVAHTSTLRTLDELREYVDRDGGGRVARHAGPYLLGAMDLLPGHLHHRSVAGLDEVCRWLEPDGWLSATQAHAMREAADRSLAEYDRQLALTVGRADNKPPHGAADLLAVQECALTHQKCARSRGR